ncbi:sorbosone dehydrogenase family protein, partial [Enterobacter hormaechei]|nr:sorbosone dehydrogenase family protein [Enterobacter hormaechei]
MAKHILPTVAALALAAALSACAGKAEYHPADQSGPQPPLPKPANFLMPPMQVPKGVGWADGQTPTVAEGLKIERIAANLQHPRRLLTLPNGDVLVVEGNGPGEEPVTTPKQWIAGKVKARSGKAGKGGNRVTLLRRTPGTNTWTQHVYIEGLHSPFGIQLIGDTLY